MHTRSFRLFTIALLLFVPLTARAAELRTLVQGDKTLDYLLVLPAGFNAGRAYPVLLALPPGEQSRQDAQDALDKYWEAEAKNRAWVVVSPISQRGRTFSTGLERAVPPLLDELSRTVAFEGGRAYLAGVSNGGMSAYRVATEYPERFFNLMVLPGYPPDDRAVLALRRLKELPFGVRAFVGERDKKWLDQSTLTKQRLDSYGVANTLEVQPGEGHILNLKAIELFDVLDAMRPKAPVDPVPTATIPQPARTPDAPAPLPTPPMVAPPAPAPSAPPMVASPVPPAASASLPLTPVDEATESKAVSSVIDDFHDAAAKADEERYFGHMAPEFVFLGTDATERWDRDAFRAFAHPYFAKGKAWTYRSTARHVTISPTIGPAGAEYAWFDEMLDNDHLGVTRGSGVLRKVGGEWKLCQYNLSIPVPNDMADDLAAKIRARPAQ